MHSNRVVVTFYLKSKLIIGLGLVSPIQLTLSLILSVPSKIIRSRQQMEIQLNEYHFYIADREELNKLIELA
jgi:hypothetical protein